MPVSDLSGNTPTYVFYGSNLPEFLRVTNCTLKSFEFVRTLSSDLQELQVRFLLNQIKRNETKLHWF